MTQVKIKETPTDQVIAKAAQNVIIHDERGRKIELRKPGILAQYRIVEALGDAASNPSYMQMVMPLLFVASIDDAIVPSLDKKMHVEALIQRLDEHGVEAVMKGVIEHFGASDPEADKESLKK